MNNGLWSSNRTRFQTVGIIWIVILIRSMIFLLGFIACWRFDSYTYVEHFAIHPNERGKVWEV